MQLLVNIDVDDLDAAVSFYTTAFDLRVTRRFGSNGVELQGASAPIYLLVKPTGTPAAPGTSATRNYVRHWTPVHLDIVVDDVDAAVQQALIAGATLEKPASTAKWGRIALMADPFGHGFCLVQFLGLGYDEIATSPSGASS